MCRPILALGLALALAGAVAFPGLAAEAPPAAPPAGGGKEYAISAKDQAHWAFQRLTTPVPPAAAVEARRPNPIDGFIAERLRQRGLTANPPASRLELIRRATYDLTGLPPSPAEVDAFVADESPGAWETVIDRLLASPHYGEKWGRHWLDLVRFAESNSYERDGAKPNAWRFRDYVIRALNADKPYDRFVLEQLAGDELPEGDGDGDALVATGYYRLGIWDDEPADRELARYDALDDIVATTGQVFLGLTVDCARCHHHKIDPIPQTDYYRMLSFFHGINPYRNGGPTDEQPYFATREARRAYQEKRAAVEARRTVVQASMTEIEQRFQDGLNRGFEDDAPTASPAPTPNATTLTVNANATTNKVAGRRKARQGASAKAADARKLWLEHGARVVGTNAFEVYEAQRKELETLKPESIPVEKALVVTEVEGPPPDTFVLQRGNPASLGEKVEPGFPVVLGPATSAIPPGPPLPAIGASGGSGVEPASSHGRRSRLARWIVSPENPLTARVMVNRVWQYHFGRGLVRSPNNFGLQGDPPTHPELLDWLAREWMANGWQLKALHRRIMTSEAYRRSSRGEPTGLAADPANDLFWRFDPRRLTAEEIRDTLLVVNGTLNRKLYGPSVFVDVPKEVLAGQSQPGSGWGKSTPEEQARRSIYIFVKRSLRVPILESFDVAETDRSTPVRFVTVQPTQALGLLNSSFLHRQAEIFADRLRRESGPVLADQVRLALRLVTGRPPTEHEIQRGADLAESLRREDQLSEGAALNYFCLMTLNLNEMIHLD